MDIEIGEDILKERVYKKKNEMLLVKEY